LQGLLGERQVCRQLRLLCRHGSHALRRHQSQRLLSKLDLTALLVLLHMPLLGLVQISHIHGLQGCLQSRLRRLQLPGQLAEVFATGADAKLTQARQVQGRLAQQEPLAFTLQRLAIVSNGFSALQGDLLPGQQLELDVRGQILHAQVGLVCTAVQLAQALHVGQAQANSRITQALLPQGLQTHFGLLGLLQGRHGLCRRARLPLVLFGQLLALLRALSIALAILSLAQGGLGLLGTQLNLGQRRLSLVQLGARSLSLLLALQGLLLLLGQAFQLLHHQLLVLRLLAELLSGIQQLLFGLVDHLQGLACGLQLGLHALPRSFKFIALMLGAQTGQFIHLLLVGLHLGLKILAALAQHVSFGDGFAQGSRGAPGAGEQLVALRLNGLQQGIAARGGEGCCVAAAQVAVQGLVQVLVGMVGGLLQVLPTALLHPQQAGDAPMLGLARALAGKGKAQHLRQVVLGVGARPGLRTNAQVAPGLAAQEAFVQQSHLSVQLKADLHGRRRTTVAPRAQVINRFRTVALEESCPDRANQGALARLVGAREDVQARLQAGQLEGLTKAAQLLDLQVCQTQLHALTPWRWASRLARMAKASRLTACAGCGAWPGASSCSSRNSAITSAR